MTASGAWRAVGIALIAGAFYDLVFAVAILVLPRQASSLLGIPLPPDPFYLELNGVFLILLAALYAAAASDPERYRLVAPISAGGRILGFALFVRGWAAGQPAAFLALGVADLVFAAATLVVWRRANHLSD